MFSSMKLFMDFVAGMEPITMLFLVALAGLGVIGLALIVALTALKRGKSS